MQYALSRPSRLVAVLKLGRPRYVALSLPPFLVGTAASPVHSAAYVALGTAAIFLLHFVGSIGNCIADRAEDEIDHPERIALCRGVGWERLGLLLQGSTVVYCGLLLTMALAVPLEPLPAFMWLSFVVLAIAYSFGPRLKPKRYSATLLLGTIAAAKLFVGWCGTSMSDFTEVASASLLLWAFGASLGGSKDVPNLEGDLSIGYRSVYWKIIETSRPFRHALGIILRPYVVLVATVVFTALTTGPGLRLLWGLTLLPAGAGLAILIVKARSPLVRAVVREYGYLYSLATTGAVLLCFVPTLETVAYVAGGITYFLLAGFLLHPDPVPGWSALRPRRHERV